MLRAASRLAARPALAPFGVRPLAVPVNQVARVMRMHVADEDAASKVDAIVAELEPKMKGQKGFVKVTRAVCKSEWAYEAALVFDNIDNFKAYMGSEFREKEALPYLEKISAHATDKAAIYSGNRVYDEY